MFALIFFVGSICLVQSSVVVNVYDGADKELGAMSQCNQLECDSFCRRSGYHSGTCAGDWCICHSYYHTTDRSQNVGDVTCNPSECESVCVALGYDSGACIGDSCYCRSKLRKNYIKYSPLKDVNSCNFRECDQLCRRMGFTGGVCVGERCKCDINSLFDSIPSFDNNSDGQKATDAGKDTNVAETTGAPADSGLGNEIMNNNIGDKVDESYVKKSDDQESPLLQIVTPNLTCNELDCAIKCAAKHKAGICWRGKCKCI